jgi:putative addiction module component (TIGR02574 family)
MAQPAEILEAALQLSETEREQLVEALVISLYGKDLGERWESENQKRVSDLDSGKVISTPGEAVFARLEQRFGSR